MLKKLVKSTEFWLLMSWFAVGLFVLISGQVNNIEYILLWIGLILQSIRITVKDLC